MILPDFMLEQWARTGGIDPFNAAMINPSTLDLRLGSTYVDLKTEQHCIPLDGLILIEPGSPILCTTLEIIKIPSNLRGVVYLKSSLAREGLDHALAGYVDPGFWGQLTLEFHAHIPITLQINQRIVQIELAQLVAPARKPYNGKYQGQRGPTMVIHV